VDYISNTAQDREEMLQTIGVSSIKELFKAIPDGFRLKQDMDLPEGLSEMELLKLVKEKAEKNTSLSDCISFLGAGAYDHYLPSIIDHLISRSEYYTAYTPYQAELSQGTLQAIYEYQSMICELTGMDAANASLLDGGSALGEAVLMASRITRKQKVFISQAVHPAYREVARTYGSGSSLEFIEATLAGTATDYEKLKTMIDEDVGAVVVQYPNFFGTIEELDKIQEVVSDFKRTLLIVVANPIALGILKPPSEFDADIVVGEGQVLGNSISYGGPYLGYMAVRKKYLRQMPGRIVGATADAEGKRGYVMTLQTREQHIRRGKATSNICTKEALNALAATVYMAVMGRAGIKELAKQSVKKAHYLADGISSLRGYQIINQGNFFHEFLFSSPLPAAELKQRLRKRGIIAGLDLSRMASPLKGLLVCVTEKRTKEEIDKYLNVLEEVNPDA